MTGQQEQNKRNEESMNGGACIKPLIFVVPKYCCEAVGVGANAFLRSCNVLTSVSSSSSEGVPSNSPSQLISKNGSESVSQVLDSLQNTLRALDDSLRQFSLRTRQDQQPKKTQVAASRSAFELLPNELMASIFNLAYDDSDVEAHTTPGQWLSASHMYVADFDSSRSIFQAFGPPFPPRSLPNSGQPTFLGPRIGRCQSPLNSLERAEPNSRRTMRILWRLCAGTAIAGYLSLFTS